MRAPFSPIHLQCREGLMIVFSSIVLVFFTFQILAGARTQRVYD
jgi:hypothetical protein